LPRRVDETQPAALSRVAGNSANTRSSQLERGGARSKANWSTRMSKCVVRRNWFASLRKAGLQQHLMWLKPLSASVESIVDFGCWGSSEPFVLLWTLDASEVVIVEKEEDNLRWPKNEWEILRKTNPDSLIGRSVAFVTADMRKPVPELPSGHFDLAFCENVLYQIEMESGWQGVQDAIDEMARVTKPGGWIIAVESKIGAEFEQVTNDIASKVFGHEIAMPVRTGDPKDISSSFETAGLLAVGLTSVPDWSYCYKKPLPQKNGGGSGSL
jgi:SAM-dependent methyltransferase